MSNKILVTYATRGNSTAGVAEAVGKTLAAHGAQVAVLPVSAVSDLTPYRAVVVGSAIQASEWLPEALEFVQTHRAELARTPFAAFVVCMTMSMRPAMFRGAAKNFMKPVRELVQPLSEGYFAGVIDFERMMPEEVRDNFFMRLSVRMGIFTEGDHRDWDAIRRWAEDLSAKLGQVES